MEFLTGNPFSTPVGQLIEHATSSSLQSEDWALNMEICDIINSTDEGPKYAVKAIRKRISGNKNFREVMLTLTVLEACVKNCGHKFHVLVSTRDFVEGVLVRAIIPKNNPPLVLHDKVLSIIQAWADAFRSSPDLTGVVFVYEDLRRKGLEFPMTELDGYSPIYTPDRIKKLKEDLGVVQGNLMLMSDMMTQLDPVSATSTDTELLQELYSVCKDMQDRIVELVPRLSEEKLIEELLAANDDINTTFTRYNRYERHKTNGQKATKKSPTYVNLIDLNPADKSEHQLDVATMVNHNYVSQSAVESLSSQMKRLKSGEADDPETLVQKRSLPPVELPHSERSTSVGDGLAQAQNTRPQNTGKIPVSQTSVMDDIEKWLDVGDEDDDMADSEGVTSEEFDRFLAERVKAAERLPSLNATSQDTNHSNP